MTGRRRGAFSTLLRRPGLRASTGGLLATTRTQNVSEYIVLTGAFEKIEYPEEEVFVYSFDAT